MVVAAVGDTRCVVVAGAGVAAGLSATGKQLPLSGDLFLLDRYLLMWRALNERMNDAGPRQAKPNF